MNDNKASTLSRNTSGALLKDAVREFLESDERPASADEATEIMCTLASLVNDTAPHAPFPSIPEDCWCPHRPMSDEYWMNEGWAMRYIIRATLEALDRDKNQPESRGRKFQKLMGWVK